MLRSHRWRTAENSAAYLLPHLAADARALAEMRRVTRAGGLVAARDADYGGMTWYPVLPALDEWLDLYERVARSNGGEPDAGRRLAHLGRRRGRLVPGPAR